MTATCVWKIDQKKFIKKNCIIFCEYYGAWASALLVLARTLLSLSHSLGKMGDRWPIGARDILTPAQLNEIGQLKLAIWSRGAILYIQKRVVMNLKRLGDNIKNNVFLWFSPKIKKIFFSIFILSLAKCFVGFSLFLTSAWKNSFLSLK
mgnify:CR=1 FL=1